eukprot:CAMPEP_0201579300 /NCGR_PEP_ID=MMETSP0190_2-20130828/26798_1 /ASSEMBLY_ACC=CAM_ASM_000263 /TAXON_ID=37353 /ORGANISM="Rosalina sp." /LENGTH=184 /DNA_ID=CAMNT_0048013593 /DNA_START=1501 /DNA_END=2055 /DNA_ORIENTATION=+
MMNDVIVMSLILMIDDVNDDDDAHYYDVDRYHFVSVDFHYYMMEEEGDVDSVPVVEVDDDIAVMEEETDYDENERKVDNVDVAVVVVEVVFVAVMLPDVHHDCNADVAVVEIVLVPAVTVMVVMYILNENDVVNVTVMLVVDILNVTEIEHGLVALVFAADIEYFVGIVSVVGVAVDMLLDLLD